MRTTISRLAILAFSCLTLFGADVQGVPNFHQVNDHIYRGAQPSDRGFSELAKLGIKTVIDLREAGDRTEAEKKIVQAAGMRYLSFPLAGYGAPPTELVAKVLSLFDDASAGPVFVHCRRGADRTGTMVACYRIVHDHWENAKALVEAKACGMSWTERAMQSYITHFKPQEIAVAATASTQNQ
jgi:tyrosine-protein phosphatase SIW14